VSKANGKNPFPIPADIEAIGVYTGTLKKRCGSFFLRFHWSRRNKSRSDGHIECLDPFTSFKAKLIDQGHHETFTDLKQTYNCFKKSLKL